MDSSYLGKSGLKISKLSLGTMTWGRDTDEYEAREQLDLFFESGGNLIDTADTFNAGTAEEMLGNFLSEVPRDQFLISSKAGRVSDPRQYDNSRLHQIRALELSLKRLKLDHIDIWQLHGFDPHTSFMEMADALASMINSGKVRYIGVSNFSAWQLTHLQSHLPNGTLLNSAQYEYSLLQRGIEREVLPAAHALGMGLLAWSPLGRGVLTGKYRNSVPADSRAASPHWGSFTRSLMTDAHRPIVEALAAAAQGLGTSPLDVALSWVRQSPFVVSAITGARTAAQLRALLATQNTTLPAEIISALNDVSDPGISYPDAGLPSH